MSINMWIMISGRCNCVKYELGPELCDGSGPTFPIMFWNWILSIALASCT
jgi:hypothetical protein